MRIAQGSDTHLAACEIIDMIKFWEEVKEAKPEIFIHCGDYNGGYLGYTEVQKTLEIMRDVLGWEIPVLSVLGNHDYWCKRPNSIGKPSLKDFEDNLHFIDLAFEQFNVWFLDKAGPFLKDGYEFWGHSMWYKSQNPPTSDEDFLPIGIDGNTNHYLYRKAFEALDRQESILLPDTTKIFVSHFPVYGHTTSMDHAMGGPEIGRRLLQGGLAKILLNGHAHQRHEGPVRYECGSDYGRPRLQIIEV